jgi:hypothetical protein
VFDGQRDTSAPAFCLVFCTSGNVVSTTIIRTQHEDIKVPKEQNRGPTTSISSTGVYASGVVDIFPIASFFLVLVQESKLLSNTKSDFLLDSLC